MLKELILTILAFLAVSSATFHMTSSITEGIQDVNSSPFTKIGENYYFIESKQQINWFGAANACRKMGANLASLETAKEAEALYAYLKTLKNVPDPWEFWLSGHEMETNGEYKWSGTGEKMSYTNWAKGQPSGGSEHCLVIWRECNETMIYNGVSYQRNFWYCELPGCDWSKCWKINWNDVECTIRANYICEVSQPMTASVTVWV